MPLADSTRDRLARYRRAANYLAAAQIYLRDNIMLDEPLRPEHIKPRLLGHWGTCPGINFIYAHLNQLILDTRAGVLLVTGPGHGAAANLANLWIEGTLAEFYPELTRDRAGMGRLVRAFSWPGGFPSHLSPGTPGCIHEGGELGYALSKSFGAALDNPDLIVACIIGDGEAETGPTAAAWHSNKYLDPATCGAVLPILHLNGYKIASPSIFGTMRPIELEGLFRGYGYVPLFVRGPDYDDAMASALGQAYRRIRELQRRARAGLLHAPPRWPMLIVETPKGWTGIEKLDGKPVEGSFRAHQAPAKDARDEPAHLRRLQGWLRSYRPDELFDRDGRPAPDILAACPRGDRRMGKSPHAYGGAIRRDLPLPDWRDYAVPAEPPGAATASGVAVLGGYLCAVIANSEAERNFRVVCPDELESNHLGALLRQTERAYLWPTKPGDGPLTAGGRVMEILSEHTCQGWLEGYLLTGRHGLFPCYEAFVEIVAAMVAQYAKFLKQSAEVPWRKPIAALNYLLTSEGWRQDHNGYTHQGPGFINDMLDKKASAARVYLPPDANCLLATIDHCLRSTDQINLVIAAKQPMPQWLGPDEAGAHMERGASVWAWAGSHADREPDVVLAAAGDYPTLETLAAAWHLRRDLPELAVRVANVADLMVLGTHNEHPHGLSAAGFRAIFTARRPVVFTFHGYVSALRALLFERQNPGRFLLNGYREEGTTTTPLDMQIRNGTSRYQIVLGAIEAAGPRLDPARAQEVATRYLQKIADHRRYIEEHGEDPPEVRGWRWAEELQENRGTHTANTGS